VEVEHREVHGVTLRSLLIRIELPACTIRRLVYDGEEWFCSLTQAPNLPPDLDDTADAHHQSLPIAILGAFIQARKKTTASAASTTAVPQVRAAPGYTVICDNFA
jgi:hypothetical protein